MQRCKSEPGTRLADKNAEGPARPFIDANKDGDMALTGGNSAIVISDYLEDAATRGRAVPAAIKHSLTCCAGPLQIDWRLGRSLISSEAVIEANASPRRAPPMASETAKHIYRIATNIEVSPFKRASAACALLVTYASLRFPGSHSLLTFVANEDSVFGILTSCKAKRPHGPDWPWARPMLGVAGSRDLVAPGRFPTSSLGIQRA